MRITPKTTPKDMKVPIMDDSFFLPDFFMLLTFEDPIDQPAPLTFLTLIINANDYQLSELHHT